MDNKDTTFLYKYFPLKKDRKEDLTHVKSVLEENVLYFSCLKDFNDPFDCCPIYVAPPEDFRCWIKRVSRSNKHAKADLEKVKNNWEKRKTTSKQLTGDMKSKMQRHINEETGICCFSGKSNNLLMWAHYASSHTGVCFEFKSTSNTPFFGEALQVRYMSDRPKVNVFKKSQDRIDNNFLTKSSDWKYESEYRVISPKRRPRKAYAFPGKCLIGIILGARIEQKDEIILKEIISNNHFISIKKAKLDTTMYKIIIEKI